jgi:hypothetical protein
MENQTFQNQQPFNTQISIPNSVAVLVLGIVSIALCWCYGIIGLASGIVALILAQKAKVLYEEDPDSYTLASFNNLKAGRICAIIGTILSGIYVVVVIVYILFIGAALTSLPWEQF